MYYASTLVDFASSLALLAMLAWSYGFATRTMQSLGVAQFLLGSMFGGVALLQMFSPIEVAPGLIIDMRHVPMLLAGAYLGWRGAVPCLVIALTTRIAIGGIGMEAGVMALLLTALIGLGCHEALRDRDRRGIPALLLLGGVGTFRLTALLFLPPDLAIYLLTNVFPVLLALELVVLLAIGLLLEREIGLLKSERSMRAAIKTDGGSGLLTPQALLQAYDQTLVSMMPSRGVGVLLIVPRHQDWLTRQFGAETLGAVRAAMRRRLEGELPRSDLIGLTQRGEIALICFNRDAREQAALAHYLHRAIGSDRVRLRDGAELRVAIDVSCAWSELPSPLCQMIQEARLTGGIRPTVPVTTEQGLSGVADTLFRKAAAFTR